MLIIFFFFIVISKLSRYRDNIVDMHQRMFDDRVENKEYDVRYYYIIYDDYQDDNKFFLIYSSPSGMRSNRGGNAEPSNWGLKAGRCDCKNIK